MKSDEKELLEYLKANTSMEDSDSFPYVREVVGNLGMAPKRAAYICEKWTNKGWYDYGVNVLAGWLTPGGMAANG